MFYNIKQFSELINISKQTLRNWDNNGKLISIKLKSGQYLVYFFLSNFS